MPDPAADARHMRTALRLAARANPFPNPKVGAVVVRDGRVVGEGFHRRVGGPHAEVTALARAGKRARGGVLYVTLEPCDHTGRTPPCARQVLASGVRRVVVAMLDPNPLTRGRGIRRLRRAKIRTRVGLLAAQARRLNPVFVKRMETGRPHVTVKVAQTLDGRIATARGASRWISSVPARRLAHRLRAQADGILVGVNTVLRDNPRLTVRLSGRGGARRRPPVKVVLDSRLRTPLEARLFSSAGPVWILTGRSAPLARERRLRAAGAQVIRVPERGGRVDLRPALAALVGRGLFRLLIEGGGEVIASVLEARAVDRVVWVVAPILLGGRSAVASVGGAGSVGLSRAVRLERPQLRRVGPDWVIEADVRFPRA